jgi:toxin ParE1/3/4
VSYQLSRVAEEDLIQIFLDGVELFGMAQAEKYHVKLFDAFSLLAEHPRAAHLRHEINPPVGVHPTGSHLVIYEIRQDDLVYVLRVRHGREDWI